MCLPLTWLKRSHRQQSKPSCQFHFSGVWKPTYHTSPYFTALFLKELGVNLLADDLGADVVFYSDAKSHLFKYKLDFLLFFHGAICLNLSTGWKQHVRKDCMAIFPMKWQVLFHSERHTCSSWRMDAASLTSPLCSLILARVFVSRARSIST